MRSPISMRTFPHRVAPMNDEWFPGVLLRCDEANGWSSGTTFRYLRQHAKLERFGPKPRLMIVPAAILEALAQFLLIPEERLFATTYHAELARLYGTHHPHGRLLSTQFTFHLCPACVAHTRLLKRTLMWPHLQFCPLHRMELRNTCQCGVALWPFSGKGSPFTCFACGLDWGSLPQRHIPRRSLGRERQLGLFYDYFLVEGTPKRMEYAAGSLGGMERKGGWSGGMDILKSYLIAKSFPLAIWWDAWYRRVFLLVISSPIGKNVSFWPCNMFEDSCLPPEHESSNKTLSQAQFCSRIGVNYHRWREWPNGETTHAIRGDLHLAPSTNWFTPGAAWRVMETQEQSWRTPAEHITVFSQLET